MKAKTALPIGKPAPISKPAPLKVARLGLPQGLVYFLREFGFFAIFFICLWRWIDVGLIYHGGGIVRGFPAFYSGWDFARDFLRYPGGFAEYLSAFAAQSLFYSWFGALVLTFQAGAIFVCSQSLLRSVATRR